MTPWLRAHRPTDNMSLIETYYLTYIPTGTDLQAWSFEVRVIVRRSLTTCELANTLGEPWGNRKGSPERFFSEAKSEGTEDWKTNRMRSFEGTEKQAKSEAKGEAWTKLKSSEWRGNRSLKQTLMSEAKFTANPKGKRKRSQHEVCQLSEQQAKLHNNELGRAPMRSAHKLTYTRKASPREANDVCFAKPNRFSCTQRYLDTSPNQNEALTCTSTHTWGQRWMFHILASHSRWTQA